MAHLSIMHRFNLLHEVYTESYPSNGFVSKAFGSRGAEAAADSRELEKDQNPD